MKIVVLTNFIVVSTGRNVLQHMQENLTSNQISFQTGNRRLQKLVDSMNE
ncbi:hypothetical protein [Pseudogracilibacillus auburnensis]|uniref:Uncharacterized protein n=1 Tax=Pseudogracilibacillus auburnensis TaxID=1494959 RepID=A0A2V3W2Y2_9BACI|nr:hypothetical protein [Pseudogracilibacillus auburnensis]MBO1005739.1 hypothetical protein [Pseudogracilibacillus auburnensis]PXW88086.1 hypothetical protein DFR56_104239 [Pseudogracilibacillus auburnensis]